MTKYTSRSRNRRRGMSLVEVSLSTLLVGILLVSSLAASGFKARHQNSLEQTAMQSRVADRLLSEVLSLAFGEPSGSTTIGADTGETTTNRALWDDVDDANGYTATPPRNRNNVSRTGLIGWTESVAVQYVSPTTLLVSNTPTGLKRVSVTILAPGNRSLTRMALVANTRSSDPSSSTTTNTQWIELNATNFLDAGGPAVNVRNKP